MLLACEQLLERGDVKGLRAWRETDELVGDDAGQVIEEGLGCRLDVPTPPGRPPSEVGLEIVREPHGLNDCVVVAAELLECHLHLGDGSS